MPRKMLTTIVAALALTVGGAALQAQDGQWVETRFNRVFLRNGNFIDGHLIGETNQSVRMKLITGEMTIRKDTIELDSIGRPRVELIKMRSYQELPKLANIQPLSAKPKPETV